MSRGCFQVEGPGKWPWFWFWRAQGAGEARANPVWVWDDVEKPKFKAGWRRRFCQRNCAAGFLSMRALAGQRSEQ